MSESILNTDACCYICGRRAWIEEHHIFGGANRKKSEKYGLKCYLCHDCHNEPPDGVHHNKKNREALQEVAQRKAMLKYNWTKEDFIKEFGRSYI